MGKLLDYANKLIFEDRLDEAENMILMDSVEDKLLRAVGEVSLLDYLIKAESYLDSYDLYLYDGWENAVFLSAPKVEHYWVSFYLKVGPKTDLRGAQRLLGDKTKQNQVSYKKLPEGGYILKFKILRRSLDQIELDNRDMANEIADREDPLSQGGEGGMDMGPPQVQPPTAPMPPQSQEGLPPGM